MRNGLLLSLLLLTGCPSDAPVPNAPAPTAKTRTESKVVILYYTNQEKKAEEEARLNKLLEEGWSVVSTDTKSEQGHRAPDSGYTQVQWTVTVTLTRIVPAD